MTDAEHLAAAVAEGKSYWGNGATSRNVPGMNNRDWGRARAAGIRGAK